MKDFEFIIQLLGVLTILTTVLTSGLALRRWIEAKRKWDKFESLLNPNIGSEERKRSEKPKETELSVHESLSEVESMALLDELMARYPNAADPEHPDAKAAEKAASRIYARKQLRWKLSKLFTVALLVGASFVPVMASEAAVSTKPDSALMVPSQRTTNVPKSTCKSAAQAILIAERKNKGWKVVNVKELSTV